MNSSSDRLISQETVQYTDTKKVQVCLLISRISPNICLREFAGACNTWNGDAAFLGKLSILHLASLARKSRPRFGGFHSANNLFSPTPPKSCVTLDIFLYSTTIIPSNIVQFANRGLGWHPCKRPSCPWRWPQQDSNSASYKLFTTWHQPRSLATF